MRRGLPDSSTPRVWATASLIAIAGVLAPSARASQWFIEPAVETRLSVTDNANFEAQGEKRFDTYLEVSPRVALRAEGARLRASGTATLSATGYARQTQDERFAPHGSLTAALEAIQRFFFIEAAATATQTAENAFAPRSEATGAFNSRTVTQYRLSPYFQGRLDPDVTYLVRSDNAWTSTHGGATASDDAYLGQHMFRVDRFPRRLGGSLIVERRDTRFESDFNNALLSDTARLRLAYALADSLAIGVRGGYERSEFPGFQEESSIRGADLRWTPTERTSFDSTWERRYFGTGWNVRFSHRMPRTAWTLAISRDTVTTPQALLTVPATGDVAAWLNAAFTTRYPDPVERARVVDQLIARQGLPPSLTGPAVIFGQSAFLMTEKSGSVVLIGTRNSLVVSGFYRRGEDIPGVVSLGLDNQANLNTIQRGGSIVLSHQLTPLAALGATISYIRSDGLGESTLRSEQLSTEVRLTRRFTAKSHGFVGGRLQTFESQTPSVAAGTVGDTRRERAVFAGLNLRF